MDDKNGRSQKIIVTYIDISGSSAWSQRMSEDPEGRNQFWMRYDAAMLRFKERTNCEFYKRLGDGRMFVWEISRENEEAEMANRVLCETNLLYVRIEREIRNLRSPRPRGVRIRSMAGIASKEVYAGGEIDYLGYAPNTCHKMLGIYPEVGRITHENVIEMIPRKQAKQMGIKSELLDEPRRCPDGVHPEDVQVLFKYEVHRT